MAASPNPCGPALSAWADRNLPSPPDRVGVAYSAGADSTALLLAAHACWPGRVVALHVHHGLQAAADEFERVARATCSMLQTEMLVRHVDARHALGQSPEDAARRARYEALASMAREACADVILLGQHADDQAETVLLALSRGAGLPGLAGMAERFERSGVLFGRPLLDLDAQSLRDWLTEAGLAFVDDPSNQDRRYTRNRIRAELSPAWKASVPGYRQALARSARHAAQAQSLLEELARSDLDLVGEPPRIASLQVLSRARQANVLRWWLKRAAGHAPTESQLSELLDQVLACRTRGHRIRIRVADGWVQREADCLHFERPI